MAKEGKTEKATPKRRQKAREEGNVAKSREFGTFLTFVAMAIILFSPISVWFINQIKNIFLLGLDLTAQQAGTKLFLISMSKEAIKVLAAIVSIILIFHIINYFAQVGLLFTAKALKPNFQRMNPKNYFTNVFSLKTVFDLFKNLIIFIMVGYVAYVVFRQAVPLFSSSILTPWQTTLASLWSVFSSMIKNILTAIFVIAIIDWTYQKWDYAEKIKMSKQEVKDEQKDANGSPEVKRRQRQAMMAILRNDIINQTPEATFIVVNPTHYSVAIRWDRTKENAPRVLVKGVDQHALLIREIAKEHNIPIVEEPPLARELYRRVETKHLIPEDMYMAVIIVIKKLVSAKKINIK